MIHPDKYGYYFKGEVRYISTGLIQSKYSLTYDGTIIKVKNSAHIRVIPKQLRVFPETFEVIAPLEVVGYMGGSIPDEYIHYLPNSHYLRFRKIYHGI